MKSFKFCSLFIIVSVTFLLSLQSCKKDSKSSSPPEEEETAITNKKGVMMTFAGMSYLGDKASGTIKDSITQALKNTDYVTNGQWEMAWFGFNSEYSVLSFIVKHKNIPNTYALVFRGDNYESVENLIDTGDFLETMPWLTEVPDYPNLYIDAGSYRFLTRLMDTKGESMLPAVGSKTYLEFLKVILSDQYTAKNETTLYVTGQSFGAEMVTLNLPLLVERIESGGLLESADLHLRYYSYAEPAILSKELADYSKSLLNRYKDPDHKLEVEYKRYYNPDDVVPVCAFSNFAELSKIGYPLTDKLIIELDLLAAGVDEILNKNGIAYFHLGNDGDDFVKQVPFDNISTPIGLPAFCNTLKEFGQYSAFNHHHNNYSIAVGGSVVP